MMANPKNRESGENINRDIFNNLPCQETDNSELSNSTKSSLNSDTIKLYSIFQQEYSIIAEYKMISTENLHGVYVIPSFESSFLWFGVIFVRSGYYEGGVFRFKLILPDTFPDCDIPSVIFQSQVFHPSIDPNTGNLTLNEVFPKWTKSENHIWQILKYVHWIFQNINIKIPANNDALKLYKSNRILFAEKAKESVMLSIDHLYDEPPTNDKHYICFSPYDPSVHDSVKASMLNPILTAETTNQGLSWVQPGTFEPFTKNNEIR